MQKQELEIGFLCRVDSWTPRGYFKGVWKNWREMRKESNCYTQLDNEGRQASFWAPLSNMKTLSSGVQGTFAHRFQMWATLTKWCLAHNCAFLQNSKSLTECCFHSPAQFTELSPKGTLHTHAWLSRSAPFSKGWETLELTKISSPQLTFRSLVLATSNLKCINE